MRYYMNVDTGKVIEREWDDEPYGDLWMEIDEAEYRMQNSYRPSVSEQDMWEDMWRGNDM